MQNLKPLTVSVFFFALACERIVFETHSTESRLLWDRKIYCLYCSRTGKYTVYIALGPENILFTGASVQLSTRKFLQTGAVKGLTGGDGEHEDTLGHGLTISTCPGRAHPQ